MTLIIDGHNLIPQVPGMQLSDMDDETQLVEYLKQYCRRKRVNVEVFFDGALPGSKPTSGGGMVHVHYVRRGKTADIAIIEFVDRQGKAASNHTVVSSDRRVQTEVHARGCKILSSAQFATEMINVLGQIEVYSKDDDQPLKPGEVDKWLDLFNKNKKEP